LLLAYEKYERASGKKLGGFFRLSADAGANFGPERPLPPATPSEITSFAFTQNGLVAVYGLSTRGEAAAPNIFCGRLATDDATWSEPVQINDEQDSAVLNAGGFFSILKRSESEIDCVWTDSRRGFWLTFFSASQTVGAPGLPTRQWSTTFAKGRNCLLG